ncbi:hypothetical protein EBZ80_22995 [bacterium]|nr:hypothetical protein [bacterium]
MRRCAQFKFKSEVEGRLPVPASKLTSTFPFNFNSSRNPISYLLSPSRRGLAAAAVMALALSAATGWGQQSITTAGSAVTQNFDSMGTSGTASFPTGFKTSPTNAIFNWTSAGLTAVTQAAGTSGTGALTGTSAAGVYNFANGVTGSSNDRALGFLNGNSYTSPRSIIYAFQNNTGQTITSITVSWNYEKYRAGTRAFDWNFFHGSDPATVANAATGGDQSYGADAANAVVDPPTSIAKTVTITGLSIASGSTYYLRWTFTGNGGSTNGQGIGIDNFSITLGPGISGAATATAFTTTYGTASAVQSFTVSGVNLTANLVATAPTGFEVSSDGTTYGSTATFTQSGGSASGTLRVRLKADAAVSGSYNSQNIVLSSTGATSVNIATASSGNAVSTKALTITGLSAANKNWDGTTTASVTGTPAYSGLVNSESFSVTGTVTWAFADANVGSNKTLTRTGSYDAPSSNYTVTQPTLTASINAVVPGAPTITGITAGNAQLSVAFTAPSSNGGSAITNYKYSTDGGSTFTAVSPAATTSPITITGLSNGTSYNVQILAVNAAGDGTASTGVNGTPTAPAVPTVTVGSLSGALTTTYGAASAERTFTVSGSTLTNNLTVTAPTGLEVSTTSGSSFADSLNLPATSGTVSNTTVYVRLKSSAPVAGNYNNVSITITGGGDDKSVSTSTGNSVTAKALTVSGATATSRVYDGTTTIAITGGSLTTGSGAGQVLSGDAANVTLGGSPTGTVSSKDVGNTKSVTVTGYSLSGSAAGNYSVTQPTGLSADITAKALTIGAPTIAPKAYDGTTTAGAVTVGTLSGFVGSETVTATGAAAAYSSANVGTYNNVTVTYTLANGTNGGLATNYSLANGSATGTITKASQTISGVNATTNQVVGATYALGATVTSGLTLSYSSSNTGVATVDSSGNVTVVGAGTATLTVSQAGNSNYNAATDVTQVLTATAAPLVAWEVTGLSSYGASPFAANSANNNITATGLIRGSGVTTSGTAATDAWGGNGFDASSLVAATTAGDVVSFTLQAKSGYSISLSGIPAYNIRRSATGPTTGQWQYSLDGTSFANIGSAITWGNVTNLHHRRQQSDG